MLKSFFCVFLFFVAVCNSFAGDKACKEVIKNFWDGYTFGKPETIRYISMDFYAKDNQIFSRKSFENYVKDFNSYKDLVRKKQYAEAMTLFKKLLDQSSVKVVKRDTRTWAQLSEKERQASISFMKSSLKTSKYMVKQNQTMQIKPLMDRLKCLLERKDKKIKKSTPDWVVDVISKLQKEREKS